MMSLKKFLYKDYEWEQQPYKNKKGYRLVHCYKGRWKQWGINSTQLLRHKVLLCIMFCLCTILFFSANTIFCDMNQIKAVKICTLVAFAAIVFLFFGVLFFTFSKRKITESAALLQKQLILWSAGIGATSLIFNIIFGIVIMNLRLQRGDIYVLLYNVLSLILEIIIFFIQKKINFEDVEN